MKKIIFLITIFTFYSGQSQIMAGGNGYSFFKWSNGNVKASGKNNLGQFNNPQGITIDSQGNLYIADTNNFKIRKITFD